MSQYIGYFSEEDCQLKKTKKADMKKILSPLLVKYYEEAKATMYVAADIYSSTEDTVIFTSVIECGMGDDAEGLSARQYLWDNLYDVLSVTFLDQGRNVT